MFGTPEKIFGEIGERESSEIGICLEMFGIYIHKSNTLQFPHGLSIWDFAFVDLGFWIWDAGVLSCVSMD